MSPPQGNGGVARSGAPHDRPSALDDLATVWSAAFARRPWAWVIGLALVAAAGLADGAPGAAAFVVAAAAIAAPQMQRWTTQRACLVSVGALAVPALLDSGDKIAARTALPWSAAVAAAVATIVSVQWQRRAAIAWALFGIAAAGLATAVFHVAHDDHLTMFAMLAAAALTAVVCADPRTGVALAAVGVGAVALAVSRFTDLASADGAVAFLHRLVAGVAVWGALVVIVRAARRDVPTRTEDDAASARLVIRVQRRPWTTAIVACLVGRAFEPGLAAAWLSVGQAGRFFWSPARMGAAVPVLALIAVGTHSAWAFGRFIVAASIVPALELAWLATRGGAAPVASPAVSWIELAWPFGQFAIAWLAARRDPGPRPGGALVITALTVTATAMLAQSFGNGGSGTTAVWWMLLGTWTFVFHRLATSERSGGAMVTAWIGANVAGALGGLVWIAGREPNLLMGSAWTWDAGPRSYVPGVLAAAALNTLHGAICVLAARRLRSMTVVPDTHPLIADFGVDLVPVGGPSGVAPAP
ncbi:MAG: hypothetical protein K8T90_05710 [Planctomycetes bacterium]|nr:hypothetical protein [Planctomycetota bacterium]